MYSNPVPVERFLHLIVLILICEVLDVRSCLDTDHLTRAVTGGLIRSKGDAMYVPCVWMVGREVHEAGGGWRVKGTVEEVEMESWEWVLVEWCYWICLILSLFFGGDTVPPCIYHSTD